MKKRMTVAFMTLGCKVNQCETAAIRSEFIKNGFEEVPFGTAADVFVINTCAVTHKSETESLRAIRRCRRENPEGVIAVCGCATELQKSSAMKEADLTLGNGEKSKIFALVREFLQNRRPYVSTTTVEDFPCYDVMAEKDYADKTRAFLKIEDGCENFCAYCIIPYVRGKIRSKPLEDVLSDVRNALANGYCEVVLTGINVTAYGKDLPGDVSLLSLIEKISDEVMPRIRLGSVEPGFLSRYALERLKEIPAFCPHFHLSLQSGSDGVLKRMNRHYLSADFVSEVALIREYYPNSGITTDIIAGFPGETVKEHRETLEFVRKIRFLKVHVFPYSKREGTAAASMPDHISKEEKKRRAAEISAVAKASRQECLKESVGASVSVLCERGQGGEYEGLSENYIRTYFESENHCAGEIVRVKIKEIYKDGVKAEKI